MQYYEIGFFVFNQDSLTVLGDQGLRKILADIVYMIPKDTVDDALSNCVFLMLGEKRGVPAAYIHEKLIKGKSICAFYEMLYCKDRDDQIDMVLHEIAHHVLGHIDEGLSEEEYFNNEKEANSLKDRWINDWEKHYRALEEERMKPWKGGD